MFTLIPAKPKNRLLLILSFFYSARLRARLVLYSNSNEYFGCLVLCELLKSLKFFIWTFVCFVPLHRQSSSKLSLRYLIFAITIHNNLKGSLTLFVLLYLPNWFLFKKHTLSNSRKLDFYHSKLKAQGQLYMSCSHLLCIKLPDLLKSLSRPCSLQLIARDLKVASPKITVS